MPRYRRLILPLCAATLFAAGCSETLETGYQPRKLGSSGTERRGYYASPFTPESQAASLSHDQEIDARRPRPGY